MVESQLSLELFVERAVLRLQLKKQLTFVALQERDGVAADHHLRTVRHLPKIAQALRQRLPEVG